jgi:hypothetical protein
MSGVGQVRGACRALPDRNDFPDQSGTAAKSAQFAKHRALLGCTQAGHGRRKRHENEIGALYPQMCDLYFHHQDPRFIYLL